MTIVGNYRMLGELETMRRSRRWQGDMSLRAGVSEARADFDRLLGELRPKLHRYCARMTGSVIDGEDVLQEALVKAIEAFPVRADRQSGGMDVSHRPQCGAGFSAAPRPAGCRAAPKRTRT